MPRKHPKTVRRELLLHLYNRYQSDPLEMLGPDDFLHEEGWSREELVPNIHYLHDRKLIELMFGYNPPLFSAARILAAGIDLVEHPFEFNRLFPRAPHEESDKHGLVVTLVEQLVDEVDFAPVEGHARRNQLRDAQYLRDEVAMPAGKWRVDTIKTLLDWIAAPLENPEESLPALLVLRQALGEIHEGFNKE